ncbi:MAG: hypothetical protein AB1631_20520 [Acidobacteriota bacterium]
MLIIKPEQMDAFKATADAAFVRRVASYLREKHGEVIVELPNATMAVKQIPEDMLCEMARKGVERAREYGMTWESSLTAFVVLMFVTAPNFDDHPLIQRAMRDESIPPDLRIDQLWERTTDQNWEAVERGYDPQGWGVG